MVGIVLTRKEQITETAKNMFRERGYPATSMRDLAKAVGIEPASLYSHIRSKEALLSAICDHIADEFLEAMDIVLAMELPPEDCFRQAVIAHIGVIANNIDASAVFFNEWRHLTGEALSSFMNKRHKYEDAFRDILKRGIEEKVFLDTDTHFAMRLVFSAINGTHEWYHPNGKLSPEEIGSRICDLILTGLYKVLDNPNL